MASNFQIPDSCKSTNTQLLLWRNTSRLKIMFWVVYVRIMTFYSVACTVSFSTWIFAFCFKMDNKVKRKVQTSINCCYKRKVKIHIAFTKLFILLSMIACQSGWLPTWIIMGFRARFVSSTSRKNYSFQLNNVMYMTRFIPPVIIRLKILFVF